MMMHPDRWEVGSLFHTAPYDMASGAGARPWEHGVLTGCGRDALRLIANRYERFWVPSYFCQEVIQAIRSTGVELATYPDSPLTLRLDLSKVPATEGDAVLVVNYFGLRSQHDVEVPSELAAHLVEDHTHSPVSEWAFQSTADFCIASLRKLYPLADGGVVWSPRGHATPEAPALTGELESGALEKLSGMELKRLYLEGHEIEKPAFRSLLESGEQRLYGRRASSITPISRALLRTFPLQAWREARRRNFETLSSRVGSRPGFRILRPSSDRSVPFSAFCVFENETECARVRDQLISKRVYASRLWPLDDAQGAEEIPDDHVRLAYRAFSLPIDMRYVEDDMLRVAEELARALDATRP